MIVRPEQIATLSDDMVARYVERVRAHLVRFWPEKCDAMGGDGVRICIYVAIARLSRDGVDSEFEVARYLDLVCEFDWDVQHKNLPDFAREVLSSSEFVGAEKIDELYRRAGCPMEDDEKPAEDEQEPVDETDDVSDEV